MKLRPFVLQAALAIAAALPLVSQAATQIVRPTHPVKPSFPVVALPVAASQGLRAIELLGDRLPEVAAWYGKSPDEFRMLLLRDRMLRIDGQGRLFVEEEIDAQLQAALPADESLLSGNLLPLDQTFLLHSRPGASRTIYLNFKGATLSGTAWNRTVSTINALPYDLDGIPYSFSTTELQRIQGIWQRVAEDFAPFDVNVTTEEPPADVLLRSSGSDQVFGTTVLVTNNNGVYSCSCGGVAYVGVFDDTGSYYKPALVFYNKLSSGSEKMVAEAISHEVGHNLGLQHDGSASTSYYSGHGTGVTGWAPIMGVGYSRALVQWSKGEYSGANNVQDDLQVMQSTGAPLRADDHGDTIGAATVLAGTASGGISSYAMQGVIERGSDVDQFAFAAGAGTVTVTLAPALRSPNLDALIELRNAAGTVLASANPTDLLNASFSAVVPQAGTYYVSVRGTGKGDPLAGGYSAYGSLGNYLVSVSAPTPPQLPPVAAVTATPISGTVPLTVNLSASGSSDPDGNIVSYQWTFGDSTSGTGASVGHTYTTVGTFTAQLKVIDNDGLSATKAVTIVVLEPTGVKSVSVGDISMSLSPKPSGDAAIAAVRIVDEAGLPVAGASVSGKWSGLWTISITRTTGSDGIARFTSGASGSPGSFVFSVINVKRSGSTYVKSLNVETSDSITR